METLSPLHLNQESLFNLADNYANYLDLVKQFNTDRLAFNAETDKWVMLYNGNKTSQNLLNLHLIIPSRFSALREALLKMHAQVNSYHIAQEWFNRQKIDLQKEMRHLCGMSRRARVAKHKFELLTHPTPYVDKLVSSRDPAFYKVYLKNLNCPQLGLDPSDFHLPLLNPVSEENFHCLKTNELVLA